MLIRTKKRDTGVCSLTAKKHGQKGQLNFIWKINSSKMICNVRIFSQTFLVYKEFFKYSSLAFDGKTYIFLFFNCLSFVTLSFSRKSKKMKS